MQEKVFGLWWSFRLVRFRWLVGIGLALVLAGALMWGNSALLMFAAMDREQTPALFASVEILSAEHVEAVIAARYPIGLERADLVARLEADGFSIAAPGRANMVWDSGICLTMIVVDWIEAEGRVTEIGSRLDWGCP